MRKAKSLEKRLVEARLSEIRDEAAKRYGKEVLELSSVRSLESHRYVFEVKKCIGVPDGYLEPVVALTKDTAEILGWAGLFRNVQRHIIDL